MCDVATASKYNDDDDVISQKQPLEANKPRWLKKKKVSSLSTSLSLAKSL